MVEPACVFRSLAVGVVVFRVAYLEESAPAVVSCSGVVVGCNTHLLSTLGVVHRL